MADRVTSMLPGAVTVSADKVMPVSTGGVPSGVPLLMSLSAARTGWDSSVSAMAGMGSILRRSKRLMSRGILFLNNWFFM